MIVKLLTEHNLEFLSLKAGCRGSSESTHVKMPYSWKSHAMPHFIFCLYMYFIFPLHSFYSNYSILLQYPYGIVAIHTRTVLNDENNNAMVDNKVRDSKRCQSSF